MNGNEAGFAWRTFNLNWLPVALLGAVLSCTIICTDFSLEPIAFGVTIAIALLLALIVYGCALIKPEFADPKLIFWFGATAQVIVVTAIVGPLSYVANAVNCPLQDQTLLLIDRAIGLDPQPIADFVNDHSWLAKCLNIGYGFIKWPLLGVPIILAMTSRFIRLQQFILALNIALAVTIIISVFVPAIGTYYGLNLSPTERFPLVNSAYYTAQLRDIVALRDGSLRHLELFRLAGIVSFPSFHAASAVLYVWALWPVRGFRWVTVGINTWMIAATPVIGAHYIIDIVGGAVVTAGSVLLAKYLFQILASKGSAGSEESLSAGTVLQYGGSR
jgi:membrane-associated phospholipid phosphatase